MTRSKTEMSTENMTFKYFDFFIVAFVAILILSNLMASKAAALQLNFWPFDGYVFEYGAAVIFFPVSYIIGDILTEVYGYARARRVVWMGFGAMIFMAVSTQIVLAMPPADRWDGQAQYDYVFGATPRIVFASITAFWLGEIANAYVMAKMKVWSKGKHLWQRTIGSTIVGQGIDSAIFYPIAFYGMWETEMLINIAIFAWVTKVLWEAFLTPVTYLVINRLKKAEGVDIYDTKTDFTPFSVKR